VQESSQFGNRTISHQDSVRRLPPSLRNATWKSNVPVGNSLTHEMIASSMQASTTIPRFLLPQLTWGVKAVKPASIGGVGEARRHRSFSAIPRPAPQVGFGAIQQLNIKPSQFSVGFNVSQTLHSDPRTFRRNFSATAPQARDHHFDTLKFVQRLKDEGFTEEQAEAMMRVLSDVIEERYTIFILYDQASTDFLPPSIQNLTRTMVLREDQERATYTQKVDFAKLRSELMTADSTELSLTRASHERLTNELAKLNSRLRDEIQRTQASVRLDLNLEKGRIREEANVQELKIKETETRIEQETAQLRERLEAVKFSTLQWLM